MTSTNATLCTSSQFQENWAYLAGPSVLAAALGLAVAVTFTVGSLIGGHVA